jgi:hypothetical protein
MSSTPISSIGVFAFQFVAPFPIRRAPRWLINRGRSLRLAVLDDLKE